MEASHDAHGCDDQQDPHGARLEQVRKIGRAHELEHQCQANGQGTHQVRRETLLRRQRADLTAQTRCDL